MGEKYRDIFYIFDNPVPFKTLLFYPVRMTDYMEFATFSECLTIDKNSIPDAKVISMSYLDYLIFYSTSENLWIAKLDRLLRICLKLGKKQSDITYMKDDKDRAYLVIKGEIIKSDDFDEIVDIICEQNLVEREDYTIDKTVRDALKEAEEFKNRSGNNKMGGLEDQILCLVASTSLTVEDISNLTIRKFMKLLERVDLKLHYAIYLSATMSGMVTFKDTSFIKHWMSDLKKDKLNPNLVSKDSIEKKLNGNL